ncbi:MAG: alpha/beta hydrolase [Myxococcota bacterium]|nr:alpha/beta hydrolase [Myxococcota bacterium]
MRTALLATAAVGAALLLTAFSPSFLLDRMIFQPSRWISVTPEALALPATEHFLETEDGVRVHSYWLPAQGEKLDLSLLYLHGNAGNASHRLPLAGQLSRLGVDVLLLDYRGYGRSEGRPSEPGVARDARAALAFLTEERGRKLEEIVVMGVSLGGAVAVELAMGRPLAGLILQSTFTSVADISRATVGFGLGPLLVDRFPSDRRIGRTQSPLLQLHGDRDTIIPFDLGQQLFRRAPEPKRFHRVRGAGHNDVSIVGGAGYYEALLDFLRSVSPRTGLGDGG